MSKELEELEMRATQKIITDPAQIERIIAYLLSLPFTYLRQDESRYSFLRGEIRDGFKVCETDLERLSLGEFLMIMSHMQERPYYAFPDRELDDYSEELASAGCCFALAIVIQNQSYKDIRIREFMHIGLKAFRKYLYQRTRDDCGKGRITREAGYELRHGVAVCMKKASSYMKLDLNKPAGCSDPTIGDLISKALKGCLERWLFFQRSWNRYRDEILNSYGVLCLLFMNAILAPFVYEESDRVRRIVGEGLTEDDEVYFGIPDATPDEMPCTK